MIYTNVNRRTEGNANSVPILLDLGLGDVEGLSVEVGNLRNAVQVNDTNIRTLDGRITGVEESLNRITLDLERSFRNIDRTFHHPQTGLFVRVGDIETRLTGVETRLGNMETLLQEINTKLS